MLAHADHANPTLTFDLKMNGDGSSNTNSLLTNYGRNIFGRFVCEVEQTDRQTDIHAHLLTTGLNAVLHALLNSTYT